MDFWTIMIVTFGGGIFGDDVSLLPYKSRSACGDAIETVYSTLHETFPELVIRCQVTETPSKMVYPKKRPEHLEGHW